MFMVGNEIQGDWPLDSWSLLILNVSLINMISIYLHTLSLLAAESFSNLNLHFQHKLVSVNLDKGHLTFSW